MVTLIDALASDFERGEGVRTTVPADAARALFRKLGAEPWHESQTSDGRTILVFPDPTKIPLPPTCDAEQELKKLGIKAFPFLVRYANDKRLSFDDWRTIGYWCVRIMESLIEPDARYYMPRKGADGELHWRHGLLRTLRREKKLSEWWRNYSRCTVTELRMAVVRWRIKEERRIGFSGKEQEHRILDPLVKRLAGLRKARIAETAKSDKRQ